MWCQQPKLPLCQILQNSSSARAKHIKQSSVNPITSSEWFVLFLGMVQNIQWQRKRGQDWPDNETRHVLKHNHISCQQPPREAYWMPWRKLLRNSNASEINHDSQKFNQDQEIINKILSIVFCWSVHTFIVHECRQEISKSNTPHMCHRLHFGRRYLHHIYCEPLTMSSVFSTSHQLAPLDPPQKYVQ